MPGGAMIAFAIADENVAAGFALQHESEIFRAHRRFHLRIDMFGPDYALQYFNCKCGFPWMVNQRRVIALEVEADLGVECCCRMLGNLSLIHI